MALIVENGTGLEDADSYISLVDARAYALKFGYTLPVDDTQAEIFLRKGAIDVDLHESSFAGGRLNDNQGLAWVRVNAYKCSGQNQITIPSDTVPNEAKYAQVIYADAYTKGLTVRANDDGLAVAAKEVTGAVKIAYFDNSKTGGAIEITEATDMLASLMCVNSNPFSIQTIKV